MLVFSQSLLSLDLIEEFLAKEHEDQEKARKDGDVTAGQIGTWTQGKDYYRSILIYVFVTIIRFLYIALIPMI